MRRWLAPASIARRRACTPRLLSTVTAGLYDAERIRVPVGSNGHVNVDLHNLAKVSSSSEPLLIYLPPFSTAAPSRSLARLPRFAQRYGAAVIHYRWTDDSFDHHHVDPDEVNPIQPGWPAPVHDTLTAYSWIVQNFAPSAQYARRDIYVYGSYLGASLATSMSLTECVPHERMAVRGCIAYNGIYNWTMFLPDHPIHRQTKLFPRNIFDEILAAPGDPSFDKMQSMARQLFTKPDDLFDPFASPCLLFHTPGLLVPPSFDESALSEGDPTTDMTWFLDEDGSTESVGTISLKQPRKSPLVFPPRKSHLKIPEVLLLHDTPPPLPPSLLRRRQRRTKKSYGNSFRTQADELAGLMRRSIDKVELRDRLKWDDDFDESNDEAARRIQVFDIGHNHGFQEALGKDANKLASTWLSDRTSLT